MLMALDVGEGHRSSFHGGRDLDLHPRLDPYLPATPGGGRSKRVHSVTETSCTPSLGSQSDNVVTAATPRGGPLTKLKMRLTRTKSVDKAPASCPSSSANENAAKCHVNKHGDHCDVTARCADKVTCEESKQNENTVAALTTAQKAASSKDGSSMGSPAPQSPPITAVNNTTTAQSPVLPTFNFIPGSEYFDFPCKFQCPAAATRRQTTETGPITNQSDSQQQQLKLQKRVSSLSDRGEADGASVTYTPVVNDRSPLILNATSPPPLITDPAVFVNAAIAEPPTESTSDSAADRKSTDSPPEVVRNAVGREPEEGTLTRSTTTKKRKVLSIIIPSSVNSKCGPDSAGMRQLSAAEERKIDEAMQLASSFARLTTHHEPVLTPKSMGSGSSRESLDSPGGQGTSLGGGGGHVFRFGGLRRRASEKKTFVDGLTVTCNATDIFTPDAQAAYNQLVSVSPPASASSPMTTKLPSKRAVRRSHRPAPDLPTTSAARHRPQPRLPPAHGALPRTIPTTPAALPTTPGAVSDGTLGSARGDECRRRDAERHTGVFQRSASLTEQCVLAGDATLTHHVAGIRSISSSDTTLSPSDDAHQTTPVDAPPALPPRVPLRPNKARGTSRPRPAMALPGTVKQRSMSEAARDVRPVTSAMTSSVEMVPALPRRATRSTSEVTESTHLDLAAHTAAESTHHESNDSVFTSSSSSSSQDPDEDPDEEPPKEHAPLPPAVSRPFQPVMTQWSSVERLDVSQLGLDDPVDAFWRNPAVFNYALLSGSEQNLLDGVSRSQRSENWVTGSRADDVSYEDLMEFALDGPRHRQHQQPVTSSAAAAAGAGDLDQCDEVRLMLKLLTPDVTVDQCMEALSETQWHLHNAIKLIKLTQLLSTNLADKQTCKQVLMTCQWNVHDAATYLLNCNQA